MIITNKSGQGIGVAATIVSLMFLITKTNAQAPVASFTADVTSGCSPLIVNFTDQSSGNPTSWLWDLGNGSTSSVPNPTSTYVTPGNYTIKLTVTNSSGSNTITKTNFITVNAGPTAAFSSSGTSGCAPHTVNFTDQTTGAVQWEWNFGDGATSSQQNPSHTYTISGSFNVYLKATNSQGCSNITYKQQYVKVGTGATPTFTANIPNLCALPVTVNFVNNTISDGNLSFSWNFGDGATSTVQNPSHTYTSSGTFTVTLNVQSSDGCSSSSQQTISLSGKTVSFDAPSTVCLGSPAIFNMTSSPTPVTQTWNMGDGNYYGTANVTHTYGSPGTYTVSLINEFVGGCVDTVFKTVKVVTGPSVNFTAVETASCKSPFTTSFQTAATGSYTWDFGDGNTSTSANPTHTYTSEGAFNVTLTVTGSNGCASTAKKNQYIRVQPPTLAVTNVPINDGCLPFSFTPISNVNAADGVAGYFWDFGDGGTATSKVPVHHYTNTGSYTLKLVITTNKGCTDSLIIPNAVNIGPGSPVDFSAVPTTVCVNQPVNFSTPVAGAASYTWNFGNGDNATIQNPTYAYKEAGQYSVTLVVQYANCVSRLTRENYITVSPPQAKFNAVRDCINRKKFNFTNTSVGAGNLIWDFGDGSMSTVQNPTHIYAAEGDYKVLLTISNGNCTDTISKLLQVRNSAILDFTASKTTVCKGEVFLFKAITTSAVTISAYTWKVTNSGQVTASTDSVRWTLYTASTFDVLLILTDAGGCKDSLFKPAYINSYGPTADFSVNGNGGCLGTSISFNDLSATDGIHPLAGWQWNFGDANTSNQQNPTHSYYNAGRYNVTLKVTDSYGCSATVSKPNMINITNGKAAFTTTDTLNMGCTGNSVNFVDTSSGSIISWFWEFGDGTTATDIQSPAHVYTDSGYYTVKLRIRENSGCMDSVTKINYVTIKKPKAAFGLSDTFTTCPPLTVQFRDSSYYVRKWSWNFKDGSTSPIANPVNNFFLPGVYNVTLIVTSAGGCTDSTSKRIRILGPTGNFTYSPLTGCSPLPVNYSINNTDAVKFMWDYSDGVIDSGTVTTSFHVYTTGGKFVPKVILTDVSGCRVPVIGTDTIFIEKTIVDFKADTTLFCDSASVVFTNLSTEIAPAVTYQWLFGDGNSSSAKNPVHSYASNGLYDVTLIATTPSGCTDILAKQGFIRVVKSPAGIIQSADTLCKPATFTFTAQLQPDTSAIQSWSWTFGNGQTSTQEEPSKQLFTTEGSYLNTLTLVNSSGCATTFSKTVVVNPLPDVDIYNDTMICYGTAAQLQATGAVSYTWLNPANLSCNNCSNPSANPTQDTRYVVEGTSALGCSSTDTALVRVLQPYTLSVPFTRDSVCQGKSIQLKAFGAPMYKWNPVNGLSADNIANPVLTPNTSAVYTVVGYDSLGCFTDSAFINISVLPTPTVDASSDITLAAGSTATLNISSSSNVVSYSWTPAVGLSCSNCQNPTVTGGDNISYTVKVTTASGCSATDKVNVIVTCTGANVFVPNTFTPNGDGMNDVFYIRGNGIFAVKSLRIFNRWGEMIFEKKNITANDASHGWNGLYKGQKAPSGTYVYLLEVLCTNRQLLKYNGTVSLIQ